MANGGSNVALHRQSLPQLDSTVLLLTDSGLETDLIFNHGFELPLFASFVLLDDPVGLAALRDYYVRHSQIAADARTGFLFEAATWRASIDWSRQLGYDEQSTADINRRAVSLGVELRDSFAGSVDPFVISAPIGPRGDAYRPETLMSEQEAEAYHAMQIGTLAETEADLVTAMTITYVNEAVGVVRAAAAVGIPVVISFTVETDGRLPDGSALERAIATVDDATGGGPAYYGINCAHPEHFAGVIDGDWTQRIQMVRANASRMSHAELDEAEELDDGDPEELASQYASLLTRQPQLNVLGGCCGTDARHVERIAVACAKR
jgi:S-methylmethionine-dependent homocysteine/selenocysteine methylase